MKRICLIFAAVVLALVSVLIAACGSVAPVTDSPSTDRSTQQASKSTTGPPAVQEVDGLGKQPVAAQTVPAPDGWSITLIPGTDKMLPGLEESDDADQSNVSMSRPAPPEFDASVAVDGERVVYSALYDKTPQVYLYDIPSGKVTQLTDDSPANYLEQLPVQISGDWVAWMRGYNTNDIHLRNLATGESKRFTPHQTVVSWRLVGNRLAWQEMAQLHDAKLYLYDPAVGSVQTIDAAHGLLSFDIDSERLVWAGGPGWNELYVYDLASGETEKVAQDSQQNGEFIVVRGDVIAWTDRTGDRTTLVVYRVATGGKKVVDTFGPFDPELRSDGRYVAWNRGEQDSGTEVWVYDTQTGKTIDLGGTWPSIDGGRIAWLHPSLGSAAGDVVMVHDLAGGPTTQLTNGQWCDQPPTVNGGHVVWARRNPSRADTQGRGIFVAAAK
jgi:hypothetical protein